MSALENSERVVLRCISTLLVGVTCVACGGSSSTSDASAGTGSTLDAGPLLDAAIAMDAATSMDAAPSVDAGVVCDQDGDGFARAAPECSAGGLPTDCDDGDSTMAPALAVCRDTHPNGCGVHDALAGALAIAEIGTLRTTVDALYVAGFQQFSVAVVPMAFGQLSRGLTVGSSQSGAAVTVLPVDVQQPAFTLVLSDEGPAYAALGHRDPLRGPWIAVAGRDGTADLVDASLALSRGLVHSAAVAGYGVDGVAMLTGGEPTLVVSRAGFSDATLAFISATSTQQVTLPTAGVIPWIGAAGDIAVRGSSTTLHAASRTSQVANAVVLGGSPLGGWAMVALPNAHLVLAETSEGLRAVRFPRCSGTTDCAAQGVVSAAFPYHPLNGRPLAMAMVNEFTGLLAVALAQPEDGADPQRVEVAFIHAEDPTTVVARVAVMGEGALDARPVGVVTGLAMDLGNLYGGDFLLVTATLSGVGNGEQRSTGLVLCQLQ